MNSKVLALSVVFSIASLVTVQPRAAGAGAEIKAVGTLTTIIPTPNIAERTQDILLIISRYAVNTYAGDLQGRSVALQTVVRDDVVEKKTFQTNTGTFWGTLDGSELGSFSFISHLVADRSVPGSAPFEANFVVVEGTGRGGLEGICGGGLIKTEDVGGTVVTVYNYTFRFGKDCKAND